MLVVVAVLSTYMHKVALGMIIKPLQIVTTTVSGPAFFKWASSKSHPDTSQLIGTLIFVFAHHFTSGTPTTKDAKKSGSCLPKVCRQQPHPQVLPSFTMLHIETIQRPTSKQGTINGH